MQIFRRFVFGIGLVLLLGSAASAADPRDPKTLASTASAIQRWLATAGLDKSLAVEKVRWTSRPEDPQRRWLKLELRHLGTSADVEKESALLLSRWQHFGSNSRQSLPETLFYKLVQLSGVDRGDAVVEVFVLDRGILIFHDPGTRALLIRNATDRMIRLPLLLEGLMTGRAGGQPSAVIVSGTQAAKRVSDFLTEYFTEQNRIMRLPAPTFRPKPLQEDYVGLEVEGLKSQVHTNQHYWERLQIDVELKPVPKGHQTIWHLDGRSASGNGKRPPGSYEDDMPDDELQKFAEKLARALQDSLSRQR